MELTITLYNVKWMRDLFKDDGKPKEPDQNSGQEPSKDNEQGIRSQKLAKIVDTINPDILCITEGPSSKADSSKTTSGQLKAWARKFKLTGYDAVVGFPSQGRQQELCALFKSKKIKLVHKPEEQDSKNPFDKPFLSDTNESLIKEHYQHYRPPFEIQVKKPGRDGSEIARIILAHTKSKGIFDRVDLARYEQLSLRNRQKLYAECFSIRERCNQWFEENPNVKIFVMGDINDGFGLDYYEQRFRRSAVEILLGNVWNPETILKSVLPKPKIDKFGWTPSSSSFVDKVTGDKFNVLIDHILVSQNINVKKAQVWNPNPNDAPEEVMDIKDLLINASDHFPVVAQVSL